MKSIKLDIENLHKAGSNFATLPTYRRNAGGHDGELESTKGDTT